MSVSTWLPETCEDDGAGVATLLAAPPDIDHARTRSNGPVLSWDDPLPLQPPLPVRTDLRLLLAGLSGDERSAGEANRRFACWHRAGAWHPRGSHRVPWDVALVLHPYDESHDQTGAEGIPVRGHNLSAGGVSILHAAPIPYRKVRLRPVDADGDLLEFVVTLRWCRFTRGRHYISGGAILRQACE